ncbi:Oxygen tolerance [Alteromonadaceae bacterium Bs31]|nr:Oxygen tolerance [Alteromonadaceae bacterium Bs31]
MKTIVCMLLAFVTTVIITAIRPVFAQTLDEYIQQEKLVLEMGISTDEPFVVKQGIHIWVDVGFYHLFARGTKVKIVNAADVVVIPASEFATNYSKTIKGETWSVQRWSYTIYASEAGILELPPIEVFVSLKGQNDTAVEGNLQLVAKPLDIVEPESTPSVDQWVAAPEYSVEQSWQGEKEVYQAGDALIRTIKQRVADTPAMMLIPPLTAEIDGLALYKEQPRLEDRRNRGDLVGYRTDRFIYTIEKDGKYELTSYTFYWWDSKQQSFKSIELESFTLNASGSLRRATPAQQDSSLLKNKVLWALLLLIFLALIAALSVKRRMPAKNKSQAIEIEKLFLKQIRMQQYSAALSTLYRVLQQTKGVYSIEDALNTEDALSTLHLLKACALRKECKSDVSYEQAKQLLRALRIGKAVVWPWQKRINLLLNPASQ